jgi:hypothetical protein
MTKQPIAIASVACRRLRVPTMDEPIVKVPIETQPPIQASR